MLLTILPEKKVSNESQWPKTYTSKFIQPGLVDYSDIGLGILNLPKETIDQHLINSFIDKPVVVRHKDVTTDNFVDLAVGYIKSVYYNALDGWYYCDFLITRDEGHEKIRNGWGVSCAYKVGQLGQGGKKNNIVYNGNIVTGEGEHLALVQNPRYEECRVIINGKDGILYNEKDFPNRKQEDNKMWLFGKKEEKGFSGDTLVDMGNGKKAKLSEIIAFNNSLEDKHDIDGKTEIELKNGKKITLEEAVNNMIAAQNAATDDKEKKDEDKDKEKDEGTDAKKKAENAKKFENCGCSGKDGKHTNGCTMYNEDGSDKKKDEDKDKKMENELKVLKLENEALKEAQKNMPNFIKLQQARETSEMNLELENSTKSSGTIEDKVKNSAKYFSKKA